jgi:streptogramin lyase
MRFAPVLLLVACGARPSAPEAAGPRDVWVFPDHDLLLESVAHDPTSGAFFVSSVHQRKIFRVDAAGARSDFFTAADGVFGLRVDAPRGVLWATTAALPQMIGFTPDLLGRSSLLKISLATGAVDHKWELPGQHAFGDLALDAAGAPWLSDSQGGGIYRVGDGDKLEEVVAPGRFRSPQGITFTPDGKRAYIADYPTGLYVLDVGGEPRPLGHPDDIPVRGIDGLLLHKGALIAVLNGITPHRLVRLSLDAAGESIVGAESLDVGEHVVEPTGGVLVGDRLYYVATSQWTSFDRDGKLRAAAFLTPAVVRQVQLQ